MVENMADGQEYHQLIVDGDLDLHIFNPRDIKFLIPDYLEECREKGMLQVRIVHGKGTGTLRRTVHAILDKLPWVTSYRLASEWEGGWGATLVTLSPQDQGSEIGRKAKL
jgi:dsDNA-specific endonuclease/ATPase MutS2